MFFCGYAEAQRGDYTRALDFYEQALAEAPSPSLERASIVINMASCWKNLGEYSRALKHLDSIEQEADSLKEFHHLRGVCWYYTGLYEKAIECFERAVEIDPGSAIDYANIASSLRKLGHEKEAIALYQMALEMDPSLEFARKAIEELTKNQ